MADVFLCYDRTDQERAQQVADALAAEGLSVWWDRNLLPMQRWHQVVQRELDDATSVVVLWTSASVHSHFVVEEALYGLDREILVPALLDADERPPIYFRGLHHAALHSWSGKRDHAEFQLLVRAIRQLAAGRRPAADVHTPYYEWVTTTIEPPRSVRYEDDSKEHFGPFLVTRGAHKLTLRGRFRLGVYPVSQEFYKLFVDAGGYERGDYWSGVANRTNLQGVDGRRGPAPWSDRQFPRELARHPVVGIAFHEAEAFVKWLQSEHPPHDTEWRWVLPDEDMWEFAARGNSGKQYPWGAGWKENHCNSLESGLYHTSEVDAHALGVSEFGCYDMAGNVWEFVRARDARDGYCVTRGGGFKNNGAEVRSHLRLVSVPRSHRPPDFGFRIAQVSMAPPGDDPYRDGAYASNVAGSRDARGR